MHVAPAAMTRRTMLAGTVGAIAGARALLAAPPLAYPHPAIPCRELDRRLDVPGFVAGAVARAVRRG